MNSVDRLYHQPIWGRTDPVLRRSLAGASAVGFVLLVAILLAPAMPPRPLTFEQVPERIARLILEKPRPASPPRVETARLEKVEPAARPAGTEAKAPAAEPKPAAPIAAAPRPAPQRRAEPAPLAPDQGVRGREQAKTEVAAHLKQVTGSLDKALGDLAQALPKSGQATAAPGRGPGGRSRQVRAARSGDQIGGVEGRTQLAAVDVGGSGLGGGGVTIAALTDLDVGGGGSGGTGSGAAGAAGAAGSAGSAGGGADGASGPGSDGRSNASLLAVVRRYAAGIQFCYENELKRNPGLRGKLVFSLTVDAAGRVTEVLVVDDALGASSVADCALAQIRDWAFPAVERGTTTFRTPFVFTPPQ